MTSITTKVVLPALRQLRPAGPRLASRILSRPQLPPPTFRITTRLAHSIPRPPRTTPLTNKQAPETENESARPDRPNNASYQLSITCVPCGHRSHHNISKQGYNHGSVLVACPECKNRHVISDHLGVFGERKISLEELMKEKGEIVRKGSLGEDGDIEFWPVDSMGEDPSGQSGA